MAEAKAVTPPGRRRASSGGSPVGRAGRRQERVGRVVSAKMDKTIVVEVTRHVQHPLYQRVMRRRKKFYVHDERNECREGDAVRIEETRPLSKLKRWRLVEILVRAGS